MMVVYHEYISSHSHAMEVSCPQPVLATLTMAPPSPPPQTLVSLTVDSSFKHFLSFLESKPACLGMTLEQLLSVPLKRVNSLPIPNTHTHTHTHTHLCVVVMWV